MAGPIGAVVATTRWKFTSASWHLEAHDDYYVAVRGSAAETHDPLIFR